MKTILLKIFEISMLIAWGLALYDLVENGEYIVFFFVFGVLSIAIYLYQEAKPLIT